MEKDLDCGKGVRLWNMTVNFIELFKIDIIYQLSSFSLYNVSSGHVLFEVLRCPVIMENVYATW